MRTLLLSKFNSSSAFFDFLEEKTLHIPIGMLVLLYYLNLLSGDTMKILLIEDSHVDFVLTSHKLNNYLEFPDIKWAIDGREAIEHLNKDGRFDFILLDLNMPVMDGHEFLRLYNKLFVTHCPVYILSSSDKVKDIQACRNYRFVKKFISKPITEKAVDILLGDLKRTDIADKKSKVKSTFQESYKWINSLFDKKALS